MMESEERFAAYEQRMAGLPSMGGHKLEGLIDELVQAVPAGHAIVEVGSWLGAGTARIALGVIRSGRGEDTPIHVFDRWTVSVSEVRWAKAKGLELTEGDDLLPYVQEALGALELRISYHKGEIQEAVWDGGPVALYVDDAAKRPADFLHVLEQFATSWQAGSTTIVLMDYSYWRKAPFGRRWLYKVQKHVIEANTHCFRMKMSTQARSLGTAAVFAYEGGLDVASVRRLPRVRFLLLAERFILPLFRMIP